MNQLSWILYWADVLPSVACTIGLFSSFALLASVVGTALYITEGFGDWADYCPKYSRNFRFFPHTLFLSVVFLIGSNLVPDKDTFYMIAASEVGEQALQTPEITKIRAVINKWLDEQSK